MRSRTRTTEQLTRDRGATVCATAAMALAAALLAAPAASAQGIPAAQSGFTPAQGLAPAQSFAPARTGSAQIASLAPAPAQAAQPAPAGNPGDAIRFMVERAVGGDHRVEVEVGQLDPRLQLAACRRVEPFLPPALRLWGRTSIGMRCVDGATWSVLLPITVKVFGQALVAVGPLAAGTVPAVADFRTEEVDLARENGPVVQDPAELAGKVLTRTLAAGQPLRRDAMRAPPVVASGDPVRILVVGQGFTISGDGIAMGAAAEGQKLRVRTDNGRVVTGDLHGRTVELRL